MGPDFTLVKTYLTDLRLPVFVSVSDKVTYLINFVFILRYSGKFFLFLVTSFECESLGWQVLAFLEQSVRLVGLGKFWVLCRRLNWISLSFYATHLWLLTDGGLRSLVRLVSLSAFKRYLSLHFGKDTFFRCAFLVASTWLHDSRVICHLFALRMLIDNWDDRWLRVQKLTFLADERALVPV